MLSSPEATLSSRLRMKVELALMNGAAAYRGTKELAGRGMKGGAQEPEVGDKEDVEREAGSEGPSAEGGPRRRQVLAASGPGGQRPHVPA